MALDKLMPGGSDSQVWLRIITVFDQDVLYAGLTDLVTQIDDLIPDLFIAPAGILFFESDDKFYYLL